MPSFSFISLFQSRVPFNTQKAFTVLDDRMGDAFTSSFYSGDRTDSRHVPLCKTEEMIGCSIVTTPLGEPRSRRHFLSGNCMIVASTD